MLEINIKKDIASHPEATLEDGTLSIVVQDVEFYVKGSDGNFIPVNKITVSNEWVKTVVE